MSEGKKLTTEELYNEIIVQNSEIGKNEWVNPNLQQVSEEFREDYFNITIDSFAEIVGSINVDIYRINQRWGEIQIFCKRIVY
jgi:uncharacterized metal-binding protein